MNDQDLYELRSQLTDEGFNVLTPDEINEWFPDEDCSHISFLIPDDERALTLAEWGFLILPREGVSGDE